MARFVYIDETGADGPGSKRQPLLTVVAAIVDEDKVQPLAAGLRAVAWKHLGWTPADLEFHGNEIWQGTKYWADKTPTQLIAAYEAALALLDSCEIDVAYASIHKARLNAKYDGAHDDKAYRLALQFLLEKVDALDSANKVLVADEAKEQELRAVKMVRDMQGVLGAGEVPGRQLGTIIDSLHFVSSHASPGVEIADLVGYVIQRARRKEHHPEAQAALDRLSTLVSNHTDLAGNVACRHNLMADLREQWGRALRFRSRYAEALGQTAPELLSLQMIPAERREEIGRWTMDTRDFGVATCQQLHHLKDWVIRDPTVAINKKTVEQLITDNEALRLVADICNGTKHAELDSPRSNLADPAGVTRVTHLTGRRADDGSMVAGAHHRVDTSAGHRPLIDIIDEAIGTWRAFFAKHNVGRQAASSPNHESQTE